MSASDLADPRRGRADALADKGDRVFHLLGKGAPFVGQHHQRGRAHPRVHRALVQRTRLLGRF